MFSGRLKPVDRPLRPDEVEQGLRYVVYDGMASQALASLTGSAFLVALALHLGASNVTIGVLAAIPQLAQPLQLPAIWLVRRMANRRLLSVMASAVGRLGWIVVALIPIVALPGWGLPMLISGLLVASIAAAIANCGWNSWLHDLVPKDSLGHFFGRRLAMATATGAVLSLSAAFFLDYGAPRWLPVPEYGYSVVFGTGFLFGMLALAFMARIPEPKMQPAEGSLVQSLAAPFRHRNFRQLVRFLGTWNFALYLATPFFTVYMLDRLGLDLATVIGLIVLGRVVNIGFLRIWGSFSDRISNTSVLAVCVPLSLLCIFAWTFTTLPEPHRFTLTILVVVHAVMGIAMAGITLATGNIGLRLAPRGQGTNYLAVTNFVAAGAAGLAPLLGGAMADFFVSRQLTWSLQWTGPGRTLSLPVLDLQQWDFLFLLSVVFGLYALHRLALVREEGEVADRVVVEELMAAVGREIREFSSVGVLRNLVSVGRLVTRRRPPSVAQDETHSGLTGTSAGQPDPPPGA